MSTHDAAGEVLRAGGLVPAATPVGASESVDTIDARVYGHAALGERQVVRLVPATLGPAEDLALEFIGLRSTDVVPAVARGRRQALGFPGWALANDPANGAYALAVVKDMERLARLARSKPGAARDGYDKLADQLARTVPRFLPTFFEQVGRAYIENEQASQAAAMFSRAREAERVYGLAVDEDRRREVFLEFALAGALSGKAIDDLADQLVATRAPLEAYQTFRELCVQRTLGGIPPSAGIGERLAKMTRAAGLDADAESRAVLLQLIDAPATARAAAGFWKAYRRPLLDLARQSSAVRGKLLNLLPSPQPYAANFVDWWLDLLAASGADAALTEPAGSVPPDAQPAGGPAAWLSRQVGQMNQGWRFTPSDKLPGLVERMSARLRADGAAVDLLARYTWRIDLDLIDLALALEIPLARPGEHTSLNVPTHGRAPKRDLLHIVQDPTFGPILAAGVEDTLGLHSGHADQLPNCAGVHLMLRQWLDRRAEEFEQAGLAEIGLTLGRLQKATSERTLALNPAARTRIARANLAQALARTVRGGLVDEFGWPALEAAHAKLTPGVYGVQVAESWPNLVLADEQRAIVVGPDGILLEHDLRIPAHGSPFPYPAFVYTAGQLLVAWLDSTASAMRAYWSARPNAIVELKLGFQSHLDATVSFELPGGGRTRGGRALHVGDTSVPAQTQFFTDGSTFWRPADGSRGLQEFDPVSGRAGALSLPAFLQTLVRDDADLDVRSSWLLPVMPGLEASPLGTADGLLGWGVRIERGAPRPSRVGRRIDGVEYAGQARPASAGRRSDNQLVGLVTLPGDTAPRPLTLFGQQLALWSADGTLVLFTSGFGQPSDLARGSPLVLPPLFWHCLRPRDPDGSRALRSLSDAVARQLLDAAAAEFAPDQTEFPKTRQLVERLLPKVTDPRLRDGIVGVCAVAASHAQRLAELKLLDAPAVAQPPSTVEHAVTDQELRAALSGLFTEWQYESAPPGPSQTLAQIDVVGGVATGGDMPSTLPHSPMPWAQLVGRLGAVAFRAASPATPPADRAALLALLETCAASPFITHLERVRLAEIADPPTQNPLTAYHARVLRQQDRVLFFKRGVRTWFFGYAEINPTNMRATRLLLELSPDTSFVLPKDYELVAEYSIHPSWDQPERIRDFVALLRERGPVVWRPERVERLAAQTGLTSAEAALLLAGLPGIRGYSRSSLTSEQREAIGLNQRDTNAAHETLRRLTGGTIRDVLAAAMPDDPRALWDSDDFVDQLASAWNQHVGRRVAVPDDLVRQFRAAVETSVPAAEVLAACAAPEAEPRLNRDGVWNIVLGGNGNATLVRVGDEEPVFDGALLTSLAPTFAWLFANRPVGDPVRAQLPRILERARQRLSNRDLLVGPAWPTGLPSDTRFFESLPGSPYRPARGQPIADSRDLGQLIMLWSTVGGTVYGRAVVRPAAARDTDDQDQARLMGDAIYNFNAARFLLGPGAAAMAERVAHTPVAAGGYEANPLLSVPDLVASVAGQLQLATDAAAAYLQVLTLAEPTTRNLALRNEWPTKRLKAALDELVEREVLVRATRARAGRDVFLAGPWEELKAPHLPIEGWKLALYEHAPLGRVLPLKPLHELFAEAWQRVQSGDVPAFAPVPSAGRRR